MRKTRGICIALTLFAASAICCGAQDNAQAEQEVRRLSNDEAHAFLKRDVKELGRLFSDDFVVTNPFNKFLTKQELLQQLESGAIAFSSLERQVEYIRIHGDTAVLAGHESGIPAGKLPGAGQKMNLRFTAIWMRRDGRWQEVARHASVIRPPAAP